MPQPQLAVSAIGTTRPPPHAVARICAALGGVASFAALVEHGVSRRALQRALDTGEIARARRGVYALPSIERAQRAALEHGGIPACVTAGSLLGLWTPEDPGVHVWFGASGHAHAHDGCTCVAHWDAGSALAVGALPDVSSVLLQISRCQPAEVFFAATETALRQRLLDPTARAWLRSRIAPPLRPLLDDARADADSGLESILRFRLRRHGIELRSQVHIAGVPSDFLIGTRLLLEVDGRENHHDAAKRHKDLVRDANTARLGYETLRYDYALIMHQWELVEGAILAKVAAGAHFVH